MSAIISQKIFRMASQVDDEVVAGVCLTHEAGASILSPQNAAHKSNNIVIGVVKVKPNNITAAELRNVLVRDLPTLPPNYYFLTKQGWPIREEQENEIKVLDLLDDSFVITTRRSFAQPRIGIQNSSREVLGFIFVDYNKSVLELRQALKEQLTFLSPDLLLLDGRGWPVHPSQEKELITWDLIYDGYITMRSSIAENVTNFSHSSIDTPDSYSKKRKNNDLNWSHHHGIEGKPGGQQENAECPNILISYVRAEAAKHAKDLKWQLADRGYSVFLDVDEIYGGRDWQDALNSAVQACTIFIPLITPQYGETLWTNREVKMADKLQKIIIPINFMDTWPPPCLAIQFTSLHFLPWKTNSEMEQEMLEFPGSRATDIRFWDTVYIKHVADAIIECYQGYRKESAELDQIEDDEISILKRGKGGGIMPPASLHSEVEFDSPVEQKTLIVLSAHPNDEECVNTIRVLLTSVNYDVWSSSDVADEIETSASQSSQLTSPATPIAPGFPDSCPISNNNNSQESTASDSFYHNMPKRRPSLKYSISVDPRPPTFSRSNSIATLSPMSTDKISKFRCQVLKAKAVIVLLSEDSCNAKTSKKQVYYCEHRKPVIPIMIHNFRPPSYITNFFGNDILVYKDTPEFIQELQHRVKVAVNTSTPKICKNEIRLQSDVLKLKEFIKNENCIYVMGSTRFCNARTENICIAIGQELADCKFLSIATSGFYGVGENVGRSFCEEQDLNGQKPPHLFSVLPKRDNRDFSKVSRQTLDGNFQKVPYGQTIFIGDSVCERDVIVAKTFNVCLLIEGDTGCAEEAERFVWNDNIVIPIISTGGAAAGDYRSRTWDVPPGVSENDWKLLSKKDEPVEVIASAVKRILCSLKCKEPSLIESGKPVRPKSFSKKLSAIIHN